MQTLFLSAADSARPLLDLPHLDQAWDRPSVLERMTAGDLAAHLSRAVTVVPRYLDTDAPPPFGDAADYFLALFPEVDTDLDSEMAASVRSRATEEARQGPEGVRAAWDRARADLEVRLGGEDPRRGIAVRGSSMQIGEYLATRLVELVVHADDLAASLEVPAPRFDAAATGTVIHCLTDMASRRHSPQAVIRAMTRVERAEGGVLRVF